MTTMAPRLVPRRPQPRTNASSESPMRVPPSQSTTAFAAWSSASSARRRSRAFVMRVRRVPKQKTSTRAAARLVECANCSRLRE